MIADENNLVELATPAVLIPGLIFGIMTLKKFRFIQIKIMVVWIAMVTLACLYFAGEEISWGQQLFHWSTPEIIDKINDQHETNLHNTSSWFDQKPRILLELWVLFGGIVVPLVNRARKRKYDTNDWRYWFWPHSSCFTTAILAIAVKMPEHISDMLGHLIFSFNIRYSELQEFYFGYFLMLFLLASYKKIILLSQPASQV